jgi:hypothetical protein
VGPNPIRQEVHLIALTVIEINGVVAPHGREDEPSGRGNRVAAGLSPPSGARRVGALAGTAVVRLVSIAVRSPSAQAGELGPPRAPILRAEHVGVRRDRLGERPVVPDRDHDVPTVL